MPPPPPPSDAFAALGSATGKVDGKKTMVPADLMEDIKRSILNYPRLSKVGLVEVLSSEFTKCTKSQVKFTVETIAERSGGRNDKTWKLKPGFELSTA